MLACRLEGRTAGVPRPGAVKPCSVFDISGIDMDRFVVRKAAPAAAPPMGRRWICSTADDLAEFSRHLAAHPYNTPLEGEFNDCCAEVSAYYRLLYAKSPNGKKGLSALLRWFYS